MDNGFFGTKYFAISLAIAIAIVAGAAGAYQLANVSVRSGWSDGCDAPALGGSTLEVAPEETIEDEGERRTIVYRFPAGAYAGGLADMCSPFGDITVDPSLDDAVEVTFVITSDYLAAVEETVVEAEFTSDGGRLALGAWVPRVGESGGVFNDESAHVRLQVRVPDNGPWDLRAATAAGNVHVKDVMASDLTLRSSFGNVVATGVDLAGDAILGSSSGNVILRLASVQTGSIEAKSSFGDVEVEVPQRADVGYDVDAETNFGEVTLRIGPTDEYSSDGGHAGDHERARSAGFDSKPTQVTVVASSSAGDVRVVASDTTA